MFTAAAHLAQTNVSLRGWCRTWKQGVGEPFRFNQVCRETSKISRTVALEDRIWWPWSGWLHGSYTQLAWEQYVFTWFLQETEENCSRRGRIMLREWNEKLNGNWRMNILVEYEVQTEQKTCSTNWSWTKSTWCRWDIIRSSRMRTLWTLRRLCEVQDEVWSSMRWCLLMPGTFWEM